MTRTSSTQIMEDKFVNVTAAILPGLVAIANHRSVSVDLLLEKAGLSSEQINNPGSQLSLAQFDNVLEVMKEESRDPALGLHHGLSTNLGSLQIVGTLMATSSNLRQVFDSYLKFKDIISPHIAFHLETIGQETHICYIDRPEIANKSIYPEIAISSVLAIIKSLLNRDEIKLNKVCFRHAKPEYSAEYERIFRAPIEFSHSQNKIIVSNSLLEKPLLGALPEANRKMEIEAQKQLSELYQSQKISRQITLYLEENLGKSAINIQNVSSYLKMTPRTLQRRLKDEQTSYVSLREKVRFRFAKNYLQDPSMNMDTIAGLLGFSESTNFYHAFKRWSGISPGEFRKTLLASLQPST